MTVTQVELNELVEECKQNLKNIDIPISESIYYNVFINNCKSSLGRCRKFGYGMYQIQVSKHLLKCKLELIKNIIYHELIHTIRGCFNHSYSFKYYMYLINQKLGTNIEVKNSNKQFGEQLQYKYKITCKKCGRTFYKHKLSKDRTGLRHASDNGELIIEQLY